MTQTILNPMDFQYLVGLCCYRHTPSAVSIIVGDKVFDPKAESDRDVDVSVTTVDAAGNRSAFAGFEVVRPGSRKPNINRVEGLMKKLLDMPDLTDRAIVSSTGFTDATRAKARHDGIRLYHFRPWSPGDLTTPGQPGMKPMGFYNMDLRWHEWAFRPNPSESDREWIRRIDWPHAQALDELGERHDTFPTVELAIRDIFSQATSRLREEFPMPPPEATRMPPWEFPDGFVGETREVSIVMEIGIPLFIRDNEDLLRLRELEISGVVQWYRSSSPSELREMVDVESGEMFAGAGITKMPNGAMLAAVLSSADHNMTCHLIKLTPGQQHILNRLNLVAR